MQNTHDTLLPSRRPSAAFGQFHGYINVNQHSLHIRQRDGNKKLRLGGSWMILLPSISFWLTWLFVNIMVEVLLIKDPNICIKCSNPIIFNSFTFSSVQIISIELINLLQFNIKLAVSTAASLYQSCPSKNKFFNGYTRLHQYLNNMLIYCAICNKLNMQLI